MGAREMRRLDVSDYVTDVKHGSDAVGEGKACGKGALPPPLDGLSPREACAYLPQAPTRVLIAYEHPSSPRPLAPQSLRLFLTLGWARSLGELLVMDKVRM